MNYNTCMNSLYSNIGKLIVSSLDYNEIIKSIKKEIQFFYNPDILLLLRMDLSAKNFIYVIKESNKILDNEITKLGEDLASKSLEKNDSIFIDNSNDNSSSDNKLQDFKYIIAIPIVFQSIYFGVLELYYYKESEKNIFNEDLTILKTVADFIAIAISNSLIYQNLIDMSYRDPLTGLYNLYKLKNIIDIYKKECYNRKDDQKCYIIVIYLDLNEFKMINDEYGHLVGDNILKEMALKLRNIFRKEDYIFRVGGDEFLVIVRTDDQFAVDVIKKRIDKILNENSFIGFGDKIKTSFSYGISSGNIKDIEQIINDADLSMYDYKKKIKGEK